MRAVDLDFQRRRPAWPGWALLALALAVATDAGLSWQQAQMALDNARRPVGAAEARPRVNPEAAVRDDPQLAQDLRSASAILEELSLPWDTLLRSVEGAQDERVALLSMQPDARKGVVLLVGEAKDYASILTFATRLEAEKALTRVHLTNHELRQDDPQKPFLFTLSGTWVKRP